MNEKNTFYDKVGANDIAHAINEQFGSNVESHYIKLKKTVSMPGEYSVVFKYKAIEKTFPVVIKGEVVVEKGKKDKKHAAEETVAAEKKEEKVA